MYGKELDIKSQTGGTSGNSENKIPSVEQPIPNLKTELTKIIGDRSEPSSIQKFLNTFIYSKLARVSFMALFFMFFYNLLLYIFDFFDVDEIYSYTYTLWISIIIILFTFLPVTSSYLPKSKAENLTNSQFLILTVTMFTFISSIFIAIYSTY